MKTDEQRGPFAAWLRRARTAPRPGLPKGWKVDETVRHLERAVPGVSFAVYREIEAGTRKPSDEQMRAIELVFGAVPVFTNSAGSGGLISGMPDPADLTRLYELLEIQTRAISQLAQAIAGMPTWTPAQWQAAQEAVAELEAEAGTQEPLPEPDPAPSGASPSAALGPGRLPAAVQ